jgi:DNA polymerase III subunit beta
MATLISAEVNRDVLVASLNAVAAVQTEGEVGWVQFQFSGEGQVVVSATSHNLSLKSEFRCAHTGSGVLKVSGKQLSEYVRQLPAENLQISAEIPQRLSIKCGRASAKFNLIQDPVNADVVLPKMSCAVRIKADHLEKWINCFRDFVSLDDTRFYANGALIWLDSSKGVALHAVASDSLRLAKAELTDGILVDQLAPDQVLVPKKTLDEVKRFCSSVPSDTEVEMRWDESSLFFSVQAESYTLISRSISGKYPPYQSALPQVANIKLAVNQKDLLESVRRILLFAEKNRLIKMRFDGPIIDVQSHTQGMKEGEEQVELLSPAQEPFDVSFNGAMMAGILACVKGSHVNLLWENPNRPLKITGEEQAGLNVFFLLVPTRY